MRLLPTPRTGGANRNSRQAITNAKGHRKGRSDLGLEQVVEVQMGVLPRELDGPEELPPQHRPVLAPEDVRE